MNSGDVLDLFISGWKVGKKKLFNFSLDKVLSIIAFDILALLKVGFKDGGFRGWKVEKYGNKKHAFDFKASVL